MKKILILLVAILVAFFSWNTLKDKEKETSEDQLSHNNNVVIQKDEIDESGNVIEDNIIVEDNKTTEEDNKTTEEDNKTTEEDKDKETTKEEGKKEENKQENTNNNTSNNKPAPTPTPTPVTYGKVVINYVDEQGVKIADSTTDAQAKVGSTYNYKAPAIAGYISEKTEASVSISKNNETKEVTFVYGNQDYAPYISTYYIKPTVKTGENVVIKFYVTDYYQKEYRSEDTSKTFNITIKANGKAQITKTVKAGVHEINIGSFASEGKVDFSLIATDQFGRNSHELFNYFRVHNGTIKKAYTMTQADLTKYNIKNNDNYAIRKYIDVPEISDNIIATMTEAYNNEVVPSGKYVVLIPRNINDNNKFGHKLYKYVRVKYADNYDAEKVMTESKNTRIGLQNFLNDIQAQGYNYVTLLNGIYRIDHEDTIYMPSNLTLDMNGATLKLNQFTGSGAYMLSLNNTYDSHLINGNIEGDYYEHDYANSPNNSEWVSGIGIAGISEYSSIENVNVRDITGYGVMTGMAKKDGYTFFYPMGIGGWSFKDIDRKTGKEIASNTRATSELKDITKAVTASEYISISKYLGYQGRIGNTWNIAVHFYDENKNFIKTIDGYQYRRIKYPSGTKYIRVTVYEAKGADLSIFNELTVTYFRVPTNSVISNVLIDNARCVGMAPSQMNNMLFTDMEFTRNGQSGAFSAMDAEDGWDGMQDVTFRNMNFHHNHRNDFLTCAGHNFIVENFIQGKLHIYGRTNSFVYENNNKQNVASLTIFANCRQRAGYYRVQNNTLVSASINSDGESYLKNYNWPQLIKNSTFTGRVAGATLKDETTRKYTHFAGKYINCKFETDNSYTDTWNNALGEGYYENCIFNGSSGENYGGYYKNCTLNNITGNIHGTFEIYNSKINNWTSNVGGYEPHFYLKNSTVNNLKINSGYWNRGEYIEFENNNITNTDNLLRFPHYATTYPIILKKNTITINSDNSLMHFYDDRGNGEYHRDKVILDSNNIKSTGGTKYIFTGITGKTNNPLSFEIKNNKLNNIALFENGVTNQANVTISK